MKNKNKKKTTTKNKKQNKTKKQQKTTTTKKTTTKKKKQTNKQNNTTCIFPSLARYLYDNVIRLFGAALPQNWRLTFMFATTITLLLELSCLHILSSLFDFLYKYSMVCVPTTNNLNRTFLLEYYPFFSTF